MSGRSVIDALWAFAGAPYAQSQVQHRPMKSMDLFLLAVHWKRLQLGHGVEMSGLRDMSL
jgi:hypothetical protein